MKIYTKEGYLYNCHIDNKEAPRFIKRKIIKIIKIDGKIIGVGATDINNKYGYFKYEGYYYRLPLRLKTLFNNENEFADIEDGTEFFSEYHLRENGRI